MKMSIRVLFYMIYCVLKGESYNRCAKSLTKCQCLLLASI